jgi:hypothetical protein
LFPFHTNLDDQVLPEVRIIDINPGVIRVTNIYSRRDELILKVNEDFQIIISFHTLSSEDGTGISVPYLIRLFLISPDIAPIISRPMRRFPPIPDGIVIPDGVIYPDSLSVPFYRDPRNPSGRPNLSCIP